MIMLGNSFRVLVSWRFRIIIILGILFCVTGSAGIILSIIELFQGRPKAYHYDETQGGLKIENPLWPSAGKGFWVGLAFLTTGIISIVASRERTPPSYIGFTALSGVSTILSFYLLITCIIPIQNDMKYSDSPRPDWQLNELILNSLLMAVGGFGIIIGVILTIIGSVLIDCCSDQRDLNSDIYSDDPTKLLNNTSRIV